MSDKGSAAGPLAGMIVVDFTQAAAGPFCTQHLGDLGADVIKVEPPGGDMIRGWNDRDWNGLGTYFVGLNRNKRSLQLDLRTPDGIVIGKKLCRLADVIVENFRPGVMRRLGLDYTSIASDNPRVVYTSITGYGPDGPLANTPAMDIIIQAFGGLMGITGEEGGAPVKVGAPIADLATGYVAAMGTLAALLHRERTGEGQLVSLSMLDSVISLMSNHTTGHLMFGDPVRRMGSAHPQLVPYEAFLTSDGEYLIIGILNERFWHKLCHAIGRLDWEASEQYKTNRDRVRNRQSLLSELRAIISTKDIGHWESIFVDADIPHCRVNTFESLFAHPQLSFTDTVIETKHPTAGRFKVINQPVRLSRCELAEHRAAPLAGEHNDAVLQELGFQPEEICQLREKKVISGGNS